MWSIHNNNILKHFLFGIHHESFCYDIIESRKKGGDGVKEIETKSLFQGKWFKCKFQFISSRSLSLTFNYNFGLIKINVEWKSARHLSLRHQRLMFWEFIFNFISNSPPTKCQSFIIKSPFECKVFRITLTLGNVSDHRTDTRRWKRASQHHDEMDGNENGKGKIKWKRIASRLEWEMGWKSFIFIFVIKKGVHGMIQLWRHLGPVMVKFLRQIIQTLLINEWRTFCVEWRPSLNAAPSFGNTKNISR